MIEVAILNHSSVVERRTRAVGKLSPGITFRVALLACATLIFSAGPLMGQAGRLDPTFGKGGQVITAVTGANNAIAKAVALQSDGKIVVAGGFGGGQNMGVVRYNANGTLDAGFGTGGQALANIPNSVLSLATGVGIQSNGKIVVGGTIYTLHSASALIAFGVFRFNANGSSDTTFGAGGFVTTLPFNASQCNGAAMALQPDGRILLAGGCIVRNGSGGPTSFPAMARYTVNGSLDTTFGSGGAAILGEVPTAMALQSDGKVLVTGPVSISRYNADGSLDLSFGIFGRAASVATSAISVQSDGKIVVAGTLADSLLAPSAGVEGDFVIVRYNSDGTIDENFGTHGGVLADVFAVPSRAAAVALAIQSNGGIVAGGQVSQGSSPSAFALARFTSAGILDSKFGTGGVVTTSFGQTDSVAALALQSDGQIVAAGNSLNVSAQADEFAVARYTAQ